MSPDPDGIRFWYLGQYSMASIANTNWGTYIGSLTLSPDLSCTEPIVFQTYLPGIRK